MSSSSGTNVCAVVADRDEARQHLLRHLHAREGLLRGLRVADEHRERQRQVGDVGERPPEPDGERRQHREDLAAGSARSAPRGGRRRRRRSLTIRIPCSASAGRSTCSSRCRLAPRLLAHRSRMAVDRLGGAAAVLARACRSRASTWSCRPATRTMKNSSRFDEKIAQNFSRSSSGTLSSSASCSTRSLKSQPRELAVEVERVVGQIRLGDRRCVWLLQIRHGLRDANAARKCERSPGRSAMANSSRARKPSRSRSAHRARKWPNSSSRRARRCASSAATPACSRACGAFASSPGSRSGASPAAARERLHVLGQQPRGERLGLGDLHVAVVDLAERGPGAPSPASPPSRRTGRSTARSARGCSAAAWRRCACRAARSPRRDRPPRGMNPHSSSRRTRDDPLGVVGQRPSGSSPLTGRAFTPPAPGRAASASASSRSSRSRCCDPLERGGEQHVAARLPFALLGRRAGATPGRRRPGPARGERGQRVDVDVGVAALAQRVGQLP